MEGNCNRKNILNYFIRIKINFGRDSLTKKYAYGADNLA
jgi:hypothetical protein